MTAPTVAVEWLLARAAVRATGLLHVVSRRDTGALNPVCGANPIRSREIETHARLDDVALLCEGCGAMAASIGGSVVDGVALLLGLSGSEPTARLLEVPLDALHGAGRAADEQLLDSVRLNGVVQPIIARRTTAGLEVVSGHRRLHAARAAGLDTIPAVVRDAGDDDVIIDRLLENLHRTDLDPIAQGLAYQDAIDRLGLTKQALADGLGVSRPAVSNTIRLLALPAHLQEHVAAGRLTAEQGRDLLRYAGDEQDAVADALLEQRQARAAAPRVKADPQLAGIADLLTGLLDAKVKVTRAGDRAKILLDVPQDELARLLSTLGVAA